jgi:hypothetical protein
VGGINYVNLCVLRGSLPQRTRRFSQRSTEELKIENGKLIIENGKWENAERLRLNA